MRKHLILALLLVLVAGCKEESTCSDTLSCPDATSTGGTSGSGGSNTGGNAGTGNSNSGGTGGVSTTSGSGSSAGGMGGAAGGTSASGGTAGEGGSSGAPSACDGGCSDSTPVCDDATATCVQCLESDEHCDAPTPACDPDSHECVECVETTDCAAGVCDPEAHRCVECLDAENCDDPTPHCDDEQLCVECLDNDDCTNPLEAFCDAGSCSPCQSNDDCAHLPGTTTCDTGAGECVECTGTDYASCGELDGTPLVCDSLTHTCSDHKERLAGECSTCVSDAECKLGQRCAREVFEGNELSYRCFWERGAAVGDAPANCPSVQPYVITKFDATSIDGVTADLCTLNVSTCKAHKDFNDNVDCEATSDVPDPSLCGEPDLNDAGCALYGAPQDSIYLCTVRCGTNNDCPYDESTCNTSSDVCSF